MMEHTEQAGGVPLVPLTMQEVGELDTIVQCYQQVLQRAGFSMEPPLRDEHLRLTMQVRQRIAGLLTMRETTVMFSAEERNVIKMALIVFVLFLRETPPWSTRDAIISHAQGLQQRVDGKGIAFQRLA